MYHPSRGGVRGGRDQFNWDDVKGDKHRENYLGHSLKAPVGRWQKGKDLMWYARDAKQTAEEAAASAREEVERVKQEEEEAMREALGLAPRRNNKPRVNRLDKREQEELLKRSNAGEEVDKPYAQGERIQGLGFAPVTKPEAPDEKDLLQRRAAPDEERPLAQVISHAHNREAEKADQELVTGAVKDDSRQVPDEVDKKRRRKEEKRAAKEQRREEKKAAKKLKREKRRRHSSTSSDEELVNRKGSRTKHRRHESGSSDEEHGRTLSRRDSKPESLGDHRNTRSCDSSDDAERERNHSKVYDTSSRQFHKYDDREERERSDRSGRCSRSYNREAGSSKRDRDVDIDEDTRRQKGDNDFRRQEGRDDLSRRRGRDIERRPRRSPSPLRRKPRHDSD